MKKLLFAVLYLSLLIVATLAALPYVLPVEKIGQEAVARVKEATGRDFSIGGEMNVKVWPNIALELNDVAIGNPEWAKNKQMVKLGKLKIELALMPLLDRKVEVKQFVLEQPEIFLEKNKDAKGSWEFSKPSPSSGGGAEGSKDGAAPVEVKLGLFRITEGVLVYVDQATGGGEKISALNMTVKLPTLDGALNVDGSFKYRDEVFKLSLALDALKEVLGGKGTGGQLDLSSGLMKASFTGDISAAEPYLKGALKLNVPALPALAAWGAQDPKAGEGLPFKALDLSGNLQLSATKASFLGADITLDDLKARGDFSAGFGGVRPAIMAKLALGRLDLDRLTQNGREATAEDNTPKAEASVSQGWSRDPIDFSGLKKVDADLTLETQGVVIKGIETGPSTVKVALKDGFMATGLSETTALKGSIKADVSVDASKAVPEIAGQMAVKAVELRPLLEKAANFKKLSGTGDIDITFTAQGQSQMDLVSTLTGQGAVMFKNGAIEGIDLVNIAQLVQKKLADMNIGEGKTEFVDLGGTFVIADGILNNQDFKMRGPLVQATGKGRVDLPRQTVNYRVEPMLTASSAAEKASGLVIPVDITGPFSALKIKPDFQSVIQNTVNNPEAVKQTVKDVKEQIKKIEDDIGPVKDELKGLLKGLSR